MNSGKRRILRLKRVPAPRGIRTIAKSFYCAVRGIAFCLRHERHFRVHITATAYVMYFASFYNFTAADYAVLALTCALVISMEIINTAVEVVIDKVSPRYSVYAMIGKDIASGAVLFAALGAVAVGVFMFWNPEIFQKIWGYFTADLLRPLLLLLSAAAAVLFVMTAKPRRTGMRLKAQKEKNENK